MGKQEKAEKNQALADLLGISVADLKHVRAQLAAAERGLAQETKAKRKSVVARRLKLSPGELVALRQALAGAVHDAVGPLVVQRVARLPMISAGPMPTPASSRTRNGATPRASSARSGAVISRLTYTATTRMFVTPLGDAVHQYSNCSGMRGFRHVGEADPEVVEVFLRDRVCRDRRACLVCLGAVAGRVDTVLDSLHGKRGARLSRPGTTRRAAPVTSRKKAAKPTGSKNKKKRSKKAGPKSASKRAKSYWLWDR